MLKLIEVKALNARTPKAWLTAGQFRVPCLIGRNGMASRKREGDGKSPVGVFRLEVLLFRSDAKRHQSSRLKAHRISTNDGWCDSPSHRSYNTMIKLPFGSSHERLHRTDEAYDYCVVLDYNRRPRIKGRGSAIFFHLIHAKAEHTAGCVAISRKHMEVILSQCDSNTRMAIGPISVPRCANRK